MTVESFILDGLVEYLELERELGVRQVECDRALLPTAAKPAAVPGLKPATAAKSAVAAKMVVASEPKPAGAESAKVRSIPSAVYDFVFFHDRPLSEAGMAMMEKILTALGKDVSAAPIVIEPPVPRAKVYVVLGGLALKKFMPGKAGGPGDWVKTPAGRDALITYSPEYILRFKSVTPAVEKIKREMWQGLKSVKQRCELWTKS